MTYRKDSHPELPINPDVLQPGAYRWPPHFTPAYLSIVFLGGCGGAFARYWVNGEVAAVGDLPVSTFVVNVLGAFLLGFLLEGLVRLGEDAGARRVIRLLLGTGFIGAFTTYSTFAADILSLFHQHLLVTALVYCVASLLIGIAACGAGVKLAAVHRARKEARS